MPMRGRTHSELVVLAHVDDGQVPQLRHVPSLEELALRGRTVSVEGERHRAVAVVFVREG